MANRYNKRRNAEWYQDPTVYNAEKNINAQIAGHLAKIHGEQFENMISHACEYYKAEVIASIDKTPEPMKQLGAMDTRGQFKACYKKKAKADYGGTLRGGGSVRFEAKHTEGDKIDQCRVTQEQWKDLETHHKLGAVAFVLVSFGLCDFYRIPWPVWRDMTEIYGRKHLKQHEIEQYEVPVVGGFLKFLDKLQPEPQKLSPYPGHNTCVLCGSYIPEDRQLCVKCEKGTK